MRLRETTNEYGTPVVEYRCETCSDIFTVCSAPEPEEDGNWTDCLSEKCASYDPARDADKWFDEGRVRVIPDGEGRSRLVPFQVIDGGKA